MEIEQRNQGSRASGRSAERSSLGVVEDCVAVHRPGSSARGSRGLDDQREQKSVGNAALLERLATMVGEETMRRYLGRSAKVDFGREAMRISVPNRFAADLIERRLGGALRSVSGVDSIQFEVVSGDSSGERRSSSADSALETRSPIPGRAENRRIEPESRSRSGSGVVARTDALPRNGFASGSASAPRPRSDSRKLPRPTHRSVHAAQTLDAFVVGSSNRFAYAAATRLAEGQGEVGSGPFFLYGPCGVGKTHLVNAVVNRFREACPGARTRVVTAEAFTNEYISAIRTNTIESFHRLYRKVDLLCIDDVHFLATKSGTQTELLHTFDHIGKGGGRIVLASDSHPGEIQRFSNALSSRFISGSLVRIDLPDIDTRRRMILHFANRAGLRLGSGAVAVLESAASADAGGRGLSVRDLSGIVNRVAAYLSVMGQSQGAGEISVTDVEAALRGQNGYEMAAPSIGRPVSLQHVVDRVCEGLEVSRDDLAGKGRHPRVVLSRAMVTLLARRLTRNSYPEIAHAIGRSNHSTVITAHRRIEKQISSAEAVQVGLPMDGTPISVVAERLERAVRSGG